VISFDLDKELAEVFIAPSVVKINAENFKVGFEQELYRCVVHGVLHIFGYEDKPGKKRAAMWKKQELILRKVLA
jgi:probable rRNA maturation factor